MILFDYVQRLWTFCWSSWNLSVVGNKGSAVAAGKCVTEHIEEQPQSASLPVAAPSLPHPLCLSLSLPLSLKPSLPLPLPSSHSIPSLLALSIDQCRPKWPLVCALPLYWFALSLSSLPPTPLSHYLPPSLFIPLSCSNSLSLSRSPPDLYVCMSWTAEWYVGTYTGSLS